MHRRQWYLLKFPLPPDAEAGKSFKLSVKEIVYQDEDHDETDVPYEFIDLETSHGGRSYTNSWVACFTVVCQDKRPGKRGAPTQKKWSAAAQQMFEKEYKRKQKANATAAAQGDQPPFPDLPSSLDDAFRVGHT